MNASNNGSSAAPRAKMNGKPVFTVPVKTVLNLKSGFKQKLLCDGPTFSLGDACGYACKFCYVPAQFRKLKRVADLTALHGKAHEDIVVRRENALTILRDELWHPSGKAKFGDPADRRVVYSSPSVDVAANMELVRETIEACKMIIEGTHWTIRLLSKSNLLPKIAEALRDHRDFVDEAGKQRVIFGVSTGTLDNSLAKAFETGCPLVSKRINSLHWLQDNGFRTFGMICPSLPQFDYDKFATDMAAALRVEKCEHVWAEVINVRGDSMTNTVKALQDGGFMAEASELVRVSTDRDAWEEYNRRTFEAHAKVYRGQPGKLRFLTYSNDSTRDYWTGQTDRGAVML